MTNSSAPSRPAAVIAVVILLGLLFVLFALPVLLAELQIAPYSLLTQLGKKHLLSPGHRLPVLVFLVWCLCSAILLLRRQRLGQLLALVLSGYIFLRLCAILLEVFFWIKPNPDGALRLLFFSGLFLAAFGGIFYLLLRPEVFAYLRSDQN